MHGELSRIIHSLQATFSGEPWYGSSVMSLLKRVNPAFAKEKVNEAHSMISLLMHMRVWRQYAISRIKNEPGFEVGEAANFPEDGVWKDELSNLVKSQDELVHLLEQKDDTFLMQAVPAANYPYTFYTLLHGIIQHDIYHAGQILLLTKILNN